MPRPDGTFAGKGWSRASEAAYERIFPNAATQQPAPAEPQRCCGKLGGRDDPMFCNGCPSPHAVVTKLQRLCCGGLGPCTTCPRRPVPTRSSPEVEHLAERTAAEADGWGREPDYEDLAARREEAREDRFRSYD